MSDGLKTLKDLRGEYKGKPIAYAIDAEILRGEAIKWAKADKSNYYSKQGKEETILWIKEFFNLGEEDLK